MNFYLNVFKKYAVFRGRSGREEYWTFNLISMLIGIALMITDTLNNSFSTGLEIGLLSGTYLLATLVPSLSVSVRRLHDTGRSGWWLLVALIPLVGYVALLVFLAQQSKPARNRYGVNPAESFS